MYKLEIEIDHLWEPIALAGYRDTFDSRRAALDAGRHYVLLHDLRNRNGEYCRCRAVRVGPNYWQRVWLKRAKISSLAVLGMAVEVVLAFLWGMSPPGQQIVLLGAMGLVLAMVAGSIYQIAKEEA